MRILVDIVHTADVNFYKNAIDILRKQGHEVTISVMERGNLPKIAKTELGSINIIGKHLRGNLIIKAYSNIKRIIELRSFIKKTKPEIVTSFSYYPAAAVFGKKTKSVIFHDDSEYKKQFALCKFFAKKLVVPDFITDETNSIKKYHSYKEWAYLNPKYFKPNPSALKKYKLEKNKYVFLRIIDKISLNYSNEEDMDYAPLLRSIKEMGLKAAISLEDKSRKGQFRGYILLNETAQNFYSIVYYALAFISSGDTMARESALLGVPSFYIGGRKMSVNQELINKDLLFSVEESEELQSYIKGLSTKDKEYSMSKAKKYCEKLEDTTKVIVEEILN